MKSEGRKRAFADSMEELARNLISLIRVLSECKRLTCPACRDSMANAIAVGEATMEELK
jgi:RNase P subunit RPR2